MNDYVRFAETDGPVHIYDTWKERDGPYTLCERDGGVYIPSRWLTRTNAAPSCIRCIGLATEEHR